MIIRRYATNQFAGIRNADFEFHENLNVVLGPNEAGKSTMVNGIVSTLFNPIKLGDRSKADKLFKERFMPHPSGDYIDGTIHIQGEEGEYILRKEWGTSPSITMTKPDGTVTKDEGKINEILGELLVFGQETYRRILFSKQEDLKDALHIMTSDDDTNVEVGDFLRRTVMDLDGVSLDVLESRIQDQIDLMYKRWDIERDYPENNRGVNNPYKVGYGLILESFYEKEKLLLEMKEARTKEEELEEAYGSFKEIEKRRIAALEKKQGLELIESDIRKRLQAQPEIREIQKEIDSLKRIHGDWPSRKSRCQDLKVEVESLVEKSKALEAERELSGKAGEKEDLKKKIQVLEENEISISKLDEELSKTVEMDKDDITGLEKESLEVERKLAALNAGSLTGRVLQVPEGTELYISEGIGERMEVQAGQDLDVRGVMTLESDNGLKVRIAAGKQDVDRLMDEISSARRRLAVGLEKCKAENLQEARDKFEARRNLVDDLQRLHIRRDTILGEDTLAGLRESLSQLDGLGQAREISVVKDELRDVNEQVLQKRVELGRIEEELRSWEDEYETIDNLFSIIIDRNTDLKMKEKELEGTKELPEEYPSPEDFFSALEKVRRDHEDLNTQFYSAKEKYAECERDLPDTSYEELQKEYDYSREKFSRMLKKGQVLLRIRDSFNKVKEKMDQETDKPLVESMSKYLQFLTEGSYKVMEIGDSMSIRLEGKGQVEMPSNLLSTGTRDSVGLAVRLALVENLLGDKKGMLVLDDCLVDMDPERKKNAVKMIQEFAKIHQVIFTTCSPQTAKDLNGNIIEM